MAAALDVRLNICFHAVPEHIQTDESGKYLHGTAVAVSTVQVLQQSKPEYGERIAAVECHDATVGHVGDGVARDAGNRRHQRSRTYALA